MQLNEISDNKGARKARTRVGRGIGSGKGKTCGRGHKGQKSRTGVAIKGFEGGQMPITRRLPKRGFNSLRGQVYQTVNLQDIARFIEAKKWDIKKPITSEVLLENGVVRSKPAAVKLLAKGALEQKVTLELDAASEAAKAAVEKAGGSLTIRQ